MKITTETKMSDAEIGAATTSLMRFERMRSIPAVVLLGALTLLGSMVLSTAGTVAFALGFLFMGSLALIWINRARQVASAAQRLNEIYRVEISDEAIAFTQADTTMTLPWDGMRHATRTANAWIFVPSKAGSSVLLPTRALTDAEAGKLTALLSAWPARKFRRSSL